MRPSLPLALPFVTIALAGGCFGGGPAPERTERPVHPAQAPPPGPRAGAEVALAHAAPETITVTGTVRPAKAPAPETFGPAGPFVVASQAGETTLFAAPLPFTTDLVASRRHGARTFGYYAPEGLSVMLDGRALPFERNARRPGSWGYTEDRLLIHPARAEASLASERVTLRWPKATAREASLHHDTAGLDGAAFIQRTLVEGSHSATGVLLPAPSTARWTLTIPDDGRLFLHPRLVSPAIVTADRSDGATLSVTVTPPGATPVEVLTHTVPSGGAGSDLRVDLSRWAGQAVQLTLTTSPGANPTHDLVFIEDPTVYTPDEHPERVLVFFLDTVRADHLGMYGYERPTTPTLDAWSEHAMVLEQSRTVAPWTLPSGRSILSGHQPEAWYDVDNLPSRLSAAGFYTEGIVANAYLGFAFDMHRGFDRYTYRHGQDASQTIDEALAVLDRFPDRDVMLYLQFMEAHMPYEEPPAYQRLFAGDAPTRLRLYRGGMTAWRPGREGFEDVRRYVIDRYDNNLRVLDDEVGRMLAHAGDDATVAILADHGEEFWEFGGFEHGHTFHDVVMRVPLLLRAPSLPSGGLSEPTSLLDVTPTLLGLVGLPWEDDAPGVDLGPALRGDVAARAALSQRPQAFGRPLYDGPGWAVLDGTHKLISRDGREVVWDVTGRDAERTDLAASANRSRLGEAMGQALGRDVPRVWRLTGEGRAGPEGTTLRISHPEGFVGAWKGYDPRGYHRDVKVDLDGRDVIVTVPRRDRLPPVLFLQPAGDASRTTGLALSEDGGAPAVVDADRPPSADGSRVEIVGPIGVLRATLDHAWAPPPSGVAVSAYHVDAEAELRALGYLDEDDPPPGDEEDGE